MASGNSKSKKCGGQKLYLTGKDNDGVGKGQQRGNPDLWKFLIWLVEVVRAKSEKDKNYT